MIGHWLAWLPVPTQATPAPLQATSAPVPATLPQGQPCAAPMQPTKETKMRKNRTVTSVLAMLAVLGAVGSGSDEFRSVPRPKAKLFKSQLDREKLQAAAAKRERRAAKRGGKRN